jgi:hypothetical protein
MPRPISQTHVVPAVRDPVLLVDAARGPDRGVHMTLDDTRERLASNLLADDSVGLGDGAGNGAWERRVGTDDLLPSEAVERVPVPEEARGDAVRLVELNRALQDLVAEDVTLREILSRDWERNEPEIARKNTFQTH